MAKKKKQAKIPSNIGYAGNVTVSILAGNKVISKNTYKNNGSKRLFYFLALCINGEFVTAENYRPFYIMPFQLKESEIRTPAELRAVISAGQNITTIFDQAGASKISISQDGFTEPLTSENAGHAKLFFRIPYSFLKKQEMHAFCLYDKNSSADLDSYSAYYFLTKLNPENQEEWNVLEINQEKNYNLVIEWDMQVNNQLEREAE